MSFLAVIALAAVVGSGCTGPETKLGRGFSNTYEVVRMGELRRSIEQSEINDPGSGYTAGLVTGFDRSVARTGIGLYEIITFPIPPYHPVCTDYLPAKPEFPESYKPGRFADSTFDTDTYTGFSGGDIFPFIPGSRFNVYN